MQTITYLAPALLLSSVTLANATPVELTDKLTASGGAVADYFGTSVAISGSTAIVGAYGDDSSSGSAYLFNTTTGNQIAKLTASDGAAFDKFGYSVGISGSTAIVGAYGDDDKGCFSGSAYFYDIADLQNPVETKLIADDGAADDVFEISVGISGSMAIVGAWLDDDKGTNSGSAYLYTASAPAPVPLPASLWLLGAAVGRAAGLRRVAQRRRT